MSKFKSDFLRTLDERGYIHQISDPEGLEHELVVNYTPDAPLVAEHPEIPAEHALQGFEGVRAYSADPERSKSAWLRATM